MPYRYKEKHYTIAQWEQHVSDLFPISFPDDNAANMIGCTEIYGARRFTYFGNRNSDIVDIKDVNLDSVWDYFTGFWRFNREEDAVMFKLRFY
jgi:hypothetical protein